MQKECVHILEARNRHSCTHNPINVRSHGRPKHRNEKDNIAYQSEEELLVEQTETLIKKSRGYGIACSTAPKGCAANVGFGYRHVCFSKRRDLASHWKKESIQYESLCLSA